MGIFHWIASVLVTDGVEKHNDVEVATTQKRRCGSSLLMLKLSGDVGGFIHQRGVPEGWVGGGMGRLRVVETFDDLKWMLRIVSLYARTRLDEPNNAQMPSMQRSANVA